MTANTHKTVRFAGLATGLALAALLVLAFRVPASEQPLGAGLRVQLSLPGELEADAGALIAAREMLPGAPAVRGSLELRSITHVPVRVSGRLRGDSHDLDRRLHVELKADGRRLASGPLERLRKRSRTILLEPGEATNLSARAWLPEGTEDFAGRRASATLELKARVLEERAR